MTGLFKQADEGFKAGAAQVGQLAAGQGDDVGVEAGKKVKTLGRDTQDHHPAITWLAVSAEQAGISQAVGQTGDVGIVGHQAGADFAAGQTDGPGPAQDAQDVVAGRGEAEGLQQFGYLMVQQIGGPPQVEVGLHLGPGEGRRLFDLISQAGHGKTIVVTTIVATHRAQNLLQAGSGTGARGGRC